MFAVWLFVSGYPLQDALDHLYSASDILADLIDMGGLDGGLDDGRSVVSGKSGASGMRSLRSGRSGRSKAGSSRGSALGSRQGSRRPQSAGRPMSASRRSGTARTAASSRGTGKTGRSEFGDTAGGPVAVKQLELLARIYTMLATLCGPASAERTENLLLAHDSYMEIWRVSAQALNKRLQDAQERVRLAEEKRRMAESMSVEDVKKMKGKPAVTKPSAADRNQPPAEKVDKADIEGLEPVVLPDTLQGWAGFAVGDQIVKLYAKYPKMDLGINPKTLPNAEFSLFFLQECIHMLHDQWLHLHTLPLQGLMDLVAKSCLPKNLPQPQTLLSLVSLRIASYHSMLGASEAADLHMPPADALAIKEEDRGDFVERIKQMQEHPPVFLKGSQHPYAKTVVFRNSLSMRDLWIQQAEVLLQIGRFSLARALLQEALLHARAWKDPGDHATCLYHLARLAHKDGKVAEAERLVAMCITVQKDAQFDLETYVRVMGFQAALALESESLEKVFACEEQIDSAMEHAASAIEGTSPAPDTGLALVGRLRHAKDLFNVQLLESIVAYYEREMPGTPIPDFYLGKMRQLLAETKERLQASPILHCRCLLVQYRLEKYVSRLDWSANCELLAFKPQLMRESLLLQQQKALAQQVLLEDAIPLGALTTSSVRLLFPAQTMLAEIELELASNVLWRVEVHHVERRLYALEAMPVPDFPVMEGREELLPRLMEFFRLTDQQKARRDKAIRDQEKLERQKQKKKLWQQQQREQAELLAQQAAADGKDKKKGGKKDEKGAEATVAPEAEPEPEIDPEDEISEGELTDESDEERLEAERRRVWLEGQPEEERVAEVPSLNMAMQAAGAALSMATDLFLYPNCCSTLARCLRVTFECKAVDQELRTLVDGSSPTVVHEAWNQPPDLAAAASAPAEDAKGKKPPPKGAKDAKGAKGGAKDAVERPPVDLALLRIPADVTRGNPQVPYLQQAVNHLQTGLERISDLTEYDVACELALELAKCYVHHNVAVAGRWVALAQAFQHGHDSLQQFRSVWDKNSREAAHVRQLQALRNSLGQPLQSEAYGKVREMLVRDSDTYRTLLVPTDTYTHGNILRLGEGIPAGVYCLVLFQSTAHKHFYATLLGPGGAVVCTARALVNRELLDGLIMDVDEWDQERESACTTDGQQGVDYWDSLEERFADVLLPQMVELLAPLLDAEILPFLLNSPESSLVLLPSHPLHSLPLEAYPGLEALACVSRDFSLHLHMQRYDWVAAQVEKFALPANLSYIVDPFNEAQALTDAVDGRVPKGSALGLTGAEHRPSAHEWQRVLQTPAHMVFMYTGVGRMESAVALGPLASLGLGHIRCGIVLDRSMNEAGSRRQAKHDLTILPRKRALARPERIANMFSCRRMGGIVVNLYNTHVKTNTLVTGMLLGFLEKSLPFHEPLHEHLHRDHAPTGDPLEETTAAVGAKGAKPDKGKAAKGDVVDPNIGAVHALCKSDRFNTVIYGLPVY
uniref:CHAT domain-containing protein n=1 Tax=Eutreptiella gymnastica TaxID=73025 RepID=A0A7S1I3D9_9EUGL